MEAVHQDGYFEKLRASEVKDSSWNVGKIQGSAKVENSTEIDLGIVKLDNIEIASHFPGEAEMPLGLFRYSGISRDGKEGVQSSISVDVKDVYPNLGPFAETMSGLVKHIDSFTSLTKEPLEKLQSPIFGVIYKALETGLEDTIRQAYKIWDETVGKFAKAEETFGRVKTGLANGLGNTFGNNVPQMIDKIHIANKKPINLQSKLTSFTNFSNTIRQMSNMKASDYSKNDRRSITGSSSDSSSGSSWPSLLSFKLDLGSSSDQKITPTNTTDPKAGDATRSSFELGLPTLSGDTNAPSIQFPALSSAKEIGKLLANVFLKPEEENELMRIKLGLNVEKSEAGLGLPSWPGLKPEGRLTAGIGLDLGTEAGISLRGSELIELVTKTPGVDTITGIINDHSFWDLGNTKATISPVISGKLGLAVVGEDFFKSGAWDEWPLSWIPDALLPSYGLGVFLNMPLKGGLNMTPTPKQKVSFGELENIDVGLEWEGNSFILAPTMSAQYLYGKENLPIDQIQIYKI